jgi:hypothetical protein
MRKSWLSALFCLGLLVFSGGGHLGLQALTGTPCLSQEKSILPKVIKGRTSLNGVYQLLKISQPRHFEHESCQVETSEVGWQKVTYSFSKKSPLKVTLYSSTFGSLLWKTERSFTLDSVVLIKNQANKEIYDLTVTDPVTKVVYEFELNTETSRVRLRVRH